MVKKIGLALVALSLVTAPARAQDEDAPAPKRPKVVGRNAALCEAFKDLAGKTSAYVVKVGSDAYGVILDGNVIVTTAAAAKGKTVRVSGPAGSGDARVIGVDDRNAVALLELPFAAKGLVLEKHDTAVGQIAVTVGTSKEKPLCAGVISARNRKVEPRDLSQANVLMGLMSDGIDGPKRAYAKVLQHDAPMSDETLGTPVVDSDGKLLGVNVGTGYRGSSYAISVNDLKESVAAIREGKTIEAPPEKAPEKPRAERPKAAGKAWLGASVKQSDEGGLVVEELAHGGPALEGGIRPGDRITAMDGTKVESLDDLAREISAKGPGDEVVFSVLRNGKRAKVTVKLGTKP